MQSPCLKDRTHKTKKGEIIFVRKNYGNAFLTESTGKYQTLHHLFVQLTGAVEYTDCISAEG